MPSAVKPDKKFKSVVAYLTTKIRSNELSAGDRIPSEQDLAELCGVSYMTARRAVTELVESNVLERYTGSGTYVRDAASERLVTTLNLICSVYEGPTIKTFLRAGDQQARNLGWRVNIIRLPQGEDYRAIREILSDNLSILLADTAYMDGPIIDAMKQAHGRAALVGGHLNIPGIPWVRSEAQAAVNQAVQYLRDHGHRHMAFMIESTQWSMDRIRAEAWRQCFSDPDLADKLDRRLISLGTPTYECPADNAYRAITRYLATPDPELTALVCMGAEMTFGAVHAFRDAGLRVPEDISILTLQDTTLASHVSPSITCVDEDVSSQVKAAVEILEQIHSGKVHREADWRQSIPPLLIERQSVNLKHS